MLDVFVLDTCVCVCVVVFVLVCMRERKNFIVIVTLGRHKYICAFLCFLDEASTLTESDWQ